jgi:hypothetical protein
MLSAARLRPRVRIKILEYIEEKSAGHYGGTKGQLRKFIAHMNWRHEQNRQAAANG